MIKKISRSGFSVKPKTNGHKDPVCGMEASGDLFQAEYKNKRFYFCSKHCEEQFMANPTNYVD